MTEAGIKAPVYFRASMFATDWMAMPRHAAAQTLRNMRKHGARCRATPYTRSYSMWAGIGADLFTLRVSLTA
jgi:hypothetical protein